MKCPECSDENRQKRLGQVAYSSAVLYHCQDCDHLYAVESEDDAGEED